MYSIKWHSPLQLPTSSETKIIYKIKDYQIMSSSYMRNLENCTMREFRNDNSLK